MSINKERYHRIKADLEARNVTLVAVSKTKPIADIQEMYDLGQRDFGENYVQELVDKQAQLPADIRWHFIGHLQSNKVKYISPFIHLIHGVDSLKLLKEIDKQGAKISRVLTCLLQVHIAEEETKFGFDEIELKAALPHVAELMHVRVEGLMGMASFSEDMSGVRTEFHSLHSMFRNSQPDLSLHWSTLSMGMSADYEVAIEEGSTMVRIGSLLFGERD